MKILVFGATGGTGRHLVEHALRQQHDVTAFVRDPNRLPFRDQRLTVVTGDVRHPEAVRNAVAGQEAALSALGVRPGTSPVVAEGVGNIITAMEVHGVQRLIVESAFGVTDTHRGFYAAVLWRLIKPLMRDKEAMEALVRKTSLEWTLVRPTALTNGKRRGTYRSGTDLPVSLYPCISRADVADFMLSQLTDGSYIHDTPTVTY